jgi:signal transduction histidine kinase
LRGSNSATHVSKRAEASVRARKAAALALGLGLGLGLFSYKIARAHGGTLDVVSTPAETRIAVRLPLDS